MHGKRGNLQRIIINLKTTFNQTSIIKTLNICVMKIKEKHALWWLTRVLSILIIVFSIGMFMAYQVFPDPEEISPLGTKEIIGFCIVGIGFIGLLLAWQWELPGAIISLVAYAGLAVLYPLVLAPTPMYIWPGTALLFIVLWKKRRMENNENLITHNKV